MHQVADRSGQRRLALVIATSVYHDPTFAKLRTPGEDAKQFAAVLADEGIGRFDVETLLDTPEATLRRRIAQFSAQGGPHDVALVYLSCHGVLDDRGRLYYATVDTERELLPVTAVPAGWLIEQLEDCRCRQQILILDCCHSGAFAKGTKGSGDLADVLRGGVEGRGRVVLTASRATEYSFEGDYVVGQGTASVFTGALVEGLKSGDADSNGNGVVTVNELYDYAYKEVKATGALQTPGMWSYGAEGSLLIAQNPRGAVGTPVQLPEHLKVALESPVPRVREGAVAELGRLLAGSDTERALTAREQLEHMAENDIMLVANAARRVLGVQPAPKQLVAMRMGVLQRAVDEPEPVSNLDPARRNQIAHTEIAPTHDMSVRKDAGPTGEGATLARPETILASLERLRGMKGVYFAPDIPEERLKVARAYSPVPADEEILVLVSLSIIVIGKKDCLVFGRRGLYLRNAFGSHQEAVSYMDLPGKDICISSSDGMWISIGEERLLVSGARVSAEILIDVLESLAREFSELREYRRPRFEESGRTLTAQDLMADESDTLVYKATFALDYRTLVMANRWDQKRELKQAVVKTVCGLLNSEKGGTLIIGVLEIRRAGTSYARLLLERLRVDIGYTWGPGDDAPGNYVRLPNAIIGIDAELAAAGGPVPDEDAYRSSVIQVLTDWITPGAEGYFRVETQQVDDRTICIVSVRPSRTWHWTKYSNDDLGTFYVRRGASTRAYDGYQAHLYRDGMASREGQRTSGLRRSS